MKKIFVLLIGLLICISYCISSPVYKMVKSKGEIVGRWLEVESINEYNEKGDPTYNYNYSETYDFLNYERWHTYENGKLVYTKEDLPKVNQLSETWYEYDGLGNLIYEKTVSKYTKTKYSSTQTSEVWYEYDRNGNEIHSKSSYGTDTWKTYDENGVLIQEKEIDEDGVLTSLIEYNAQGEIIHDYWKSDDYLIESFSVFDQDNHLVYSKYINNNEITETEYKRTYNENGYCVSSSSSKGTIIKREYDSEGKIIRVLSDQYGEIIYEYDGNNLIHEYSSSHETIREYDNHNNEVYYCYESSKGTTNEKWTEYEYWDNGTLKTETTYRRI